MSETVRLLVDSVSAIDESGVDPAASEIWSTSTGLHLRTGREVKSPEQFVRPGDFDQIAQETTSCIGALRAAFLALESEHQEFKNAADTLLPSVVSFTRSMSVKALLLYRWHEQRGAAQSVVAGPADCEPVAGLSIDIGRHDNAFTLLLTSDALKDQNIALARTAPVDTDQFRRIFNKVSLYDRALNILRRSTSALQYKLWDRLGHPAIGTGATGHVFLLNETATIEDCFAPLLWNGWRIEKLDLGLPPTETSTLPANFENWLAGVHEILAVCLRAPIGDDSFATAVADIVVRRLRSVLQYFPAALAHFEAAARSLVGRTDTGSGVILTNGMYAPNDRLFSSVLRSTEIKTACVDHGSAIGVPLYASQDLTENYRFCDIFLNQNRKSAKLLNEASPRPGFEAVVVGANRDLLQPRARRIGRFLAKKRLAIGFGQRCAIYASSLESNNVHLGYGAGRDIDLSHVQAGVLESASAFDGRFIVKPYPAQRYPDPAFLAATPLDGSIERAPHGELQNVRFAADLIIVDATASTLGVVLGAGCPVLFIKNRRARVARNAYEEMLQSIFCIDSDSENWQAELKEFLGQSPDILSQEWARMADRRRAFIDKRIASVAKVSSDVIPVELAKLTRGRIQQSGQVHAV